MVDPKDLGQDQECLLAALRANSRVDQVVLQASKVVLRDPSRAKVLKVPSSSRDNLLPSPNSKALSRQAPKGPKEANSQLAGKKFPASTTVRS